MTEVSPIAESSVKVVFIGDAKSLKSALDDVDGAAEKSESRFAGMGSKVALGIAGGGIALAAFGKSAFDAFEESRKIAAQTEAAIRSTGGAAGVTAEHIGDLAGAISNKTGIDDEAIQSGQNLLLTFTNLQNRAGEGNDIFDQATKTMVDMSAALGTDASGSAIQLGKALNDPIAGISALGRVGVTFTDQQKAQIKAMVEVGDVAGAQKVILAELSKEFGGSAEAQATASARMTVAFGNIQEAIGERLAPVFDGLATWILDVGIPAFDSMVSWLEQHWPQIQAVVEQVMGRVREVIETVLSGIEAFWRTWGGTITAYVQGYWDGISQIVQGAMDIIRGIIDVVMGIIHGDWSRVWDGIKSLLEGVWQVINGIVDLAINEVRTRIEIVMRLIAGVFDAAWDGIKSATSRVLAEITLVIWSGWDAIVGFVGGLPGRIVGVFTGLWDNVKGLASDAAEWVLRQIDRMLGPLDKIAGKLGSIGSKVLGAIPGFASGTGSAPAGLAWVGEAGPELVRFGGGERVYTAAQSRNMTGGAAGVQVVVNIGTAKASDGPMIGNAVADALRRQLPVLLRGAA